MAIKTANKRYMMLVNTFGNLQGNSNDAWSDTVPSGSVGYLENSLFYMGFSKNYNKVLRATKYDMASSLGGTTPPEPGGSACCIEFENYDKGYEGPMISQKVPAGTEFRREWLNVLPGQSKQVGVWPVNIALHTYVDNDYVAAQALAQAWLLKDASNTNGVAGGPSNGNSYRPCVYRHHYDSHIKNQPSCIRGLNPAQNKILYNSIATLRKHAYSKAYQTNLSLGKCIDPITASNCMNWYNPNHADELVSGKIDSNWKEPMNYAYQSNSYAGGYVSLHHLHFTTYGDTTSSFFNKMSFFIPRSTGETATKIKLTDGKYDDATNTTHYWIYFYNNRVTSNSYYNDNYAESGWAYDSPVNIPVGKVYSKITPVATNKNNEVPKYPGVEHNLNDLLTSANEISNNSAKSAETRYVASFTTSFNIYIVCEGDAVNSAPRKTRGEVILGAGETSPFDAIEEDPELDKNGNPIIFNEVIKTSSNIEIDDDLSEADLESDEFDTTLTSHESDDVSGVQICSITGFLVDYTWAYSNICTNFLNKEYIRSIHGKNVKHHQCVNKWDNWIETPKMHGLLLLQNCCNNGKARYMGGDPVNNVLPEYASNLYAPGVEEGGEKIVSSIEEPKFRLNNQSPLHITAAAPYAPADNDKRWLNVELYNVIKISNNNAKLKNPSQYISNNASEQLNNMRLTSRGCHNKCLYTTGSRLPSIVSSDTDPTASSSAYTQGGNFSLNEWYMNHYDDSCKRVTDCGVLFVQNGSKYDIKYHETYPYQPDHKSIICKTEGIVNNVNLNVKNADYVTGKLGKALEFDKKYRAKFSINKDTIRINGISLNKMASKFPLEARSYNVPNIITFKLRIDFKYYFENTEHYPQGSQVSSYPKIFDNIDQTTSYSTVGQNYILPSYKLYNDDLAIDSVGTLRDIILPSKYSETFPYYNVSLRLPLTAIDDNFCHVIGHNKFLGATCYDISNTSSTFSYVDDDGNEQTVTYENMISANSPLKGIKYVFNVINTEIGDDHKHEILTCVLKFYNDSDTFGFLDFNFKFNKFKLNDTLDSAEGKKPFIIEGSTVLSKLMNKIIIKGVINNDNSFVFSDAEFTTTIKKSLNSNLNYTVEGMEGSVQPDPAIPDGVTIREDTVTYETADATGMGNITSVVSQINSGPQLISSEENGIMNIADENSEVLVTPGNVAVLDRSTGEVIGVGNDASINFNEYGRFIESYLNPNNPSETKTAGQGDKGLGMKNVENMCITRNILPVLSNKIMVY